ncbi:MAG TPA: hypothetical protein VKB88_34515 [Bryobacteraceae bacterium]|nr:hypothetical protein [Bryobacteraceae bacterium]
MLLHVRLMSEALALIRLRLLWLAAELTAAILLRWRGLAAKLAAVIRLRLLRWLPAEMMAIDGRRRLPLGRRGLVLVYLRLVLLRRRLVLVLLMLRRRLLLMLCGL